MTNEYRPKSWYFKVINMAKTQLDIEEASYRDILKSKTGKDSLKTMTVPDLFKVLSHMKSLGFKLKANKKLSPSTAGKAEGELTMLDKLRQLWIEMYKQGFLNDGSEQALETWASNQSKRFNKGVAITKLGWLKGNVLYNLIEQLKKWHMRLLDNAIPEAYPAFYDIAKAGKLTSEQAEQYNYYIGALRTAPETHALNSGLYRLYIEIINEHKAEMEP